MTLCTQIEMHVASCHEAEFLGESKLHKCRQIGAITHSLPSPNEGSKPGSGMLSKGHFSLSSEPPLSFQHWLTLALLLCPSLAPHPGLFSLALITLRFRSFICSS